MKIWFIFEMEGDQIKCPAIYHVCDSPPPKETRAKYTGSGGSADTTLVYSSTTFISIEGRWHNTATM